jgi:hypothetical protein
MSVNKKVTMPLGYAVGAIARVSLVDAPAAWMTLPSMAHILLGPKEAFLRALAATRARE